MQANWLKPGSHCRHIFASRDFSPPDACDLTIEIQNGLLSVRFCNLYGKFTSSHPPERENCPQIRSVNQAFSSNMRFTDGNMGLIKSRFIVSIYGRFSLSGGYKRVNLH